MGLSGFVLLALVHVSSLFRCKQKIKKINALVILVILNVFTYVNKHTREIPEFKLGNI